LANICQKKAVLSLEPGVGLSITMFQKLAMSPWLWAGMASYAVALGMYLGLLARLPLNVATSIATLNFVAVLLASRLVFGEAIPPLRYLGFVCILLGMSIVAFTQRQHS
jgi:drug/metabolite transporter (DMT)-like permease